MVEIVKKSLSQEGESPMLKAVTGAMKNTSLEVQWLAEGLSFGEGLVSCQGRRVITFFLFLPSPGGGALCWYRRWRRKGGLAQIVSKYNEYRINNKRQS